MTFWGLGFETFWSGVHLTASRDKAQRPESETSRHASSLSQAQRAFSYQTLCVLRGWTQGNIDMHSNGVSALTNGRKCDVQNDSFTQVSNAPWIMSDSSCCVETSNWKKLLSSKLKRQPVFFCDLAVCQQQKCWGVSVGTPSGPLLQLPPLPKARQGSISSSSLSKALWLKLQTLLAILPKGHDCKKCSPETESKCSSFAHCYIAVRCNEPVMWLRISLHNSLQRKTTICSDSSAVV